MNTHMHTRGENSRVSLWVLHILLLEIDDIMCKQKHVVKAEQSPTRTYKYVLIPNRKH